MAGLGEGRYYKRSGDSCYKMEHVDIADMFGRRVRPALDVWLEMAVSHTTMSSPASISFAPIVVLSNRGRGLARFPMLRLNVAAPFSFNQFELGSRKTGLPEIPELEVGDLWRTFAGGADHVIHAGASIPITRLQLSVLEDSTELPDLVLQFQVACEGMGVVSGRIEMAGGDVLAFAKRDLSARRRLLR
jgi:hypothetical protein